MQDGPAAAKGVRLMRCLPWTLILCSGLALAACGGQPPPPSPTGATGASASVSTGVASGGSAAAGCVKACVYLDRAGGPGLAGVTICQSFAAYSGDPIGTTDASGAY